MVTHHADTATVVAAIKSGLEEDGLADLVQEIRIADPDGGGKGPREVYRRPAFATDKIYLPEVLRVEDGLVRKLDYEQDILFALDWGGLDPAPLAAKIPDNFTAAERQMRRIRLVDAGDERIVSEVTGNTGERLAFDPAYAVRMVSDIVPNAWIAREIVGGLVAGLYRRGFGDETLGKLHGRDRATAQVAGRRTGTDGRGAFPPGGRGVTHSSSDCAQIGTTGIGRCLRARRPRAATA